MKRPLQLTLVLLVLCSSVFAQVADSVYHNRLFYTCKAWGHIKYYHTETASGNVNWDNELLNVLFSIRNAPDNASFNTALMSMLNAAGEMRKTSGTLPDTFDSLNNNTDYSWIQDTIYSEEVQSYLENVREKFRPQRHELVGEAWPGGGVPTFDTDNLYYSNNDYPGENLRILALFRYWNIINYFFPYKYIMDQDWDITLAEFIPPIVNAANAVEYHLAFRKFTAMINDSHAFFSSPTWLDWIGKKLPPFEARYIENEMVITNVLSTVDEVKVGDVIEAIDGINMEELRDSLRQFSYGSNDVVIEREINTLILLGAREDFSITVNDGKATRTETLSRNVSGSSIFINRDEPIWKTTTVNDQCNFGIVDMGRLETIDVRDMFGDLWNTDAIVFDIRNYPNGTITEIVDYLYPTEIHLANFTVPDITYPGRLTWVDVTIGKGTNNPYEGQVIILFDERTQSHAEFTVMGLEQFPNAIKIGSTTAAADGNVAKISLPGFIDTYATFAGVYYPDYSPTQRIGILPDFEVLPTIEGIRAGKDQVLDFALNCDLVEIEDIVANVSASSDLRFYPNPATEEINYDLIKFGAVLIEIYDLQGQKLLVTDAPSGTIDISTLKQGIYVIKTHRNGHDVTSSLILKQ